ncbi:MAG TPA: RraA family protein [Opitutaceae bacterium]
MSLLSVGDLQKLRRWNSPSIANALEQISRSDPLAIVNAEETHDFMPEMGPMIGYAVTAVIGGGDPSVIKEQPDNFVRYREYLASIPGPKIVVIQDADRPRCHGAFWGEVGATNARALGCVGTITDGAVRDLDEMKAVGFKALARRLAVSHAYCWPLRWGVEVEVFGTRIKPGQLIHADKHGFIVIPRDGQKRLLEATRFMDDNECDTVIAAGLGGTGNHDSAHLAAMKKAGVRFGAATRRKFKGGTGEF